MRGNTQRFGDIRVEPEGHTTGLVLFVGACRKDGKIPVTYVFGSGARFAKLLTREAVEAAITSLETPA